MYMYIQYICTNIHIYTYVAVIVVACESVYPSNLSAPDFSNRTGEGKDSSRTATIPPAPARDHGCSWRSISRSLFIFNYQSGIIRAISSSGCAGSNTRTSS